MNETIEKLFSLKDKVAVVLGGTSGIGQAIARGYAGAGAAVIASSRDVAKVDAMAREFELAGIPTLRQPSDVQDRASLEKLCHETIRQFGRVDILMVTSGALMKTPTADMKEEDWTRIIDVNLNGSFRANQIFGRQMLAQKSGSIINTCSLTTFVSFGEVTAYAASKSGVAMLTKQLACEWAPHGVRVNAIAPGVFRTPLNEKVIDLPERKAVILPRTPMGRIGHVDELVGIAIYLAGDAASFTTGQIIAVDGGFLAKGV
ncbi:MAG: SDR family oxidoreductase [Acidobacteria bacterium]|nr:SDR family oxidoreductase [Acidobacteriota bacterium]